MTDFERDLRIAETMAHDLKEYLLSDTLYWQLTDSGPKSFPYPLGTVGGMLLRIQRLEGAGSALSPDQYQRVDKAREKADDELKHWAVQAEQKEVREIKARLQTWSAFLDDAAGDPKRHIIEYPTQVENRVIMDMLLPRAGHAADGQNFRSRLESLDARLKGLSTRGDFVWDAAFAPVFPQDKYWWLYVQFHI
jgi:hypothetical protein